MDTRNETAKRLHQQLGSVAADQGQAGHLRYMLKGALDAEHNAVVAEVREALERLFLTPHGYPRTVGLDQVHAVLDRVARR